MARPRRCFKHDRRLQLLVPFDTHAPRFWKAVPPTLIEALRQADLVLPYLASAASARISSARYSSRGLVARLTSTMAKAAAAKPGMIS